MERAAKLLGHSNLARNCITQEQIGVAAWAVAVGKKVARHTRATALIEGRLVVEVEDDLWRRNLEALGKQILARLDKEAGDGLVKKLHFVVAPRRRMPAREQRVVRGASDEADGIDEPILSLIYKASRKRATA